MRRCEHISVAKARIFFDESSEEKAEGMSSTCYLIKRDISVAKARIFFDESI